MTDQETAADTQAQGDDDTDDLISSVPDEDTDVGQMQEDLAALRTQVAQLQREVQAAQQTGGVDPELLEEAALAQSPTARIKKRQKDAEDADRELQQQLAEAHRAAEGRTFSAPHVAGASKEATKLREQAQRAAREHGFMSEEFKEADEVARRAEWQYQGLQQYERQADEVAERGMERPDTTPSGSSPQRRPEPGEGLPGRGDVTDRIGGSQTDAELALQLSKSRRGE